MAILVDTNVICGVLFNDPAWSNWSAAQLANHWGHLYINPIIYAELSYQATSLEDVNDTIVKMGLIYADLPMACLFVAGNGVALKQHRCQISLSVPTPRKRAWSSRQETRHAMQRTSPVLG